MLFDNNYDFLNFGFIDDVNNNTNNTKDLFGTKEGFLKGNLFKDEYKPYKSYPILNVVAKNKKEELLLEIMELCFAINDMNLYLDIHPNDTDMLEKFKNIVEKSIVKEMEYVKEFGPIDVIDSNSSSKFNWIDNPWPWQNDGGTKYV